MLAGAGDELQGIKRGLLEIADMIAITKADGENVNRAKLAASKYAFAMHLLRSGEQPPVVTCSSLDGSGIDEIWRIIVERTRERERSAPSRHSAARRPRTGCGRWSTSRSARRYSRPMRSAASPRTPSATSASGRCRRCSAQQAIVRALRSSGMSGWGRAEEPASCAKAAS